jgi:DNA-directed RNA polymerase subunit M/transcription elongation factor TFIIS
MSWDKFCATTDDSYFFASDEIKKIYKQKISDFCLARNLTKQLPKPSYVICRKCLSNKIWLDNKQVRSGDEGPTTFAQCSNCNSKWTMS